MRHAICYVSNAEENLSSEEIEALLNRSQEKNNTAGIKGLLLYAEGNFFQILEGEKNLVLEVFDKIREDSRHYGIIQVIGRDFERDSYDSYKVDFLTADIKYAGEIPKQYTEPLQGLPPDLKRAMERMLENFIVTR